MSKQYYVYIMASISRVLYIGVTNNLKKRVWQHKNNIIEGFTKKYKCHKLVYFETGNDINSIITKEKQLKRWRRQKKIDLIEKFNPDWNDFSLKS